jgi:hypothetical protein
MADHATSSAPRPAGRAPQHGRWPRSPPPARRSTRIAAHRMRRRRTTVQIAAAGELDRQLGDALAEPRDVRVECCGTVRGRAGLPHRLGEAIGGEDLAAVEQQHREQAPLELAARCDVGAVRSVTRSGPSTSKVVLAVSMSTPLAAECRSPSAADAGLTSAATARRQYAPSVLLVTVVRTTPIGGVDDKETRRRTS